MNDTQKPNPLHSGLFTDLYELTMAQAYAAEGMEEPAVFELFFRKMPPTRNYVLTAGLDDVLTALEKIRFTDSDLDYLQQQGQFKQPFLDRLREFRFTGDLHAMPEGTLVFPDEPMIQIVAPIFAAQLVETLMLNQIHFQSLIATKTARVVHAAAGRKVVDFGSRRAHGSDAALKVARASYLAGASGTSNALAGSLYGIPIFGTMAHSYIQAHDDERQAFKAFADLYPETTLLVDTYDTLDGIDKVIELSRTLGDRFRVRAVRLDSGDLAELAKVTRRRLDDAGLTEVKIFASSGLDEYAIADLGRQHAPIDGFGVGSKLAVSGDVPYLDVAYKLVGYAGRPRMKLSEDKVIYPGPKQVYRVTREGKLSHDLIAQADEQSEGEPLLKPVMKAGKRLDAGRVSLEAARDRARRELAALPENWHRLDRVDPPYPVRLSDNVKRDLDRTRRTLEH